MEYTNTELERNAHKRHIRFERGGKQSAFPHWLNTVYTVYYRLNHVQSDFFGR